MSALEEQTDEVLMARAQADETAAFARLYDRHAARALQVARAVCRDNGRAEEAVQEGFLSIWRSRAKFQPRMGSFQAWSMKIIHYRAIDSHRAAAAGFPTQRSDRDKAAGLVSTRPTPQEEALSSGEKDELLALLRGLPEAQAEVIVLAFFGGLTHSEIAAELSLPTGTVKGRMRLGLEKLRRQMGVAELDRG